MTQILPIPATVVLGNGRQVEVQAPERLALDGAGVLYLLDGLDPISILAAWSPGAWDAVKAAGWTGEP